MSCTTGDRKQEMSVIKIIMTREIINKNKKIDLYFTVYGEEVRCSSRSFSLVEKCFFLDPTSTTVSPFAP